jgi:hypothetical protein
MFGEGSTPVWMWDKPLITDRYALQSRCYFQDSNRFACFSRAYSEGIVKSDHFVQPFEVIGFGATIEGAYANWVHATLKRLHHMSQAQKG